MTPKTMNEQTRVYRIVMFKNKSRAFKENGFLEGIVETKRKSNKLRVEISKWHNHDKSFHINFINEDRKSTIVDSGVIEQLANEIRYRKRNGLDKDIFDDLIIINHKGEYY
jgi:hypothetical protein